MYVFNALLVGALADILDSWQKAHANGEEILATEHSRKFFEQRFHEGSDS